MLFFSQIQKAYDKCFGKDYSFDDLAETVGRDSDNDILPGEYEGGAHYDPKIKVLMFNQEMKLASIRVWLGSREMRFSLL